jgi:hypothetical protein
MNSQERKKHRKMSLPPKIIATIIAIFWLCSTARCVPNTNVTTILCNGRVYSQGDPFATSLNYVVAELESVTATHKNYDYYNISPYPNAFAYKTLTNKTFRAKSFGLRNNITNPLETQPTSQYVFSSSLFFLGFCHTTIH